MDSEEYPILEMPSGATGHFAVHVFSDQHTTESDSGDISAASASLPNFKLLSFTAVIVIPSTYIFDECCVPPTQEKSRGGAVVSTPDLVP
jgi:hypothetical protein